MSTIVCQSASSSCFDSQLTETTSAAATTTLKLKVAAPPPPPDLFEAPAIDFDRPENLEFGNWGFFRAAPRESNYYTSPWEYKSPFPAMSAKSLELCTENLGSETGSDTFTGDAAAALFSSPPVDHSPKKAEADGSNRRRKAGSNPGGCRSFPPPLTTMIGSKSLEVRRHREGGRLIIEAVEAPYRNSYLQAERSDGRLRLSFLTPEAITSVASEEEDESDGDTGATAEELGSESDEKSEIADEINNDNNNNSNNNNNNNNLEMEMEKFQWLSRCKEEGGHGNKGLCSSNWKPTLWVAIS